MPFLTVHVLRALPMHNLNRDQNGLPKSQFDGGIQRGRLSSQSIKRPARIAFREAIRGLADAPGSRRTMDAHAIELVLEVAQGFAAQQGMTFDAAAAKKTAGAVIRSLTKREEKDRKDEASDVGDTRSKKKDNILLFSEAEFETFAQALVDAQNGGEEPTVDDFILDFQSPSLDVAAFGRMFAMEGHKSTQAAVAVSHAVMTHEMPLTIDYFTAIDDLDEGSASHLGLAYYTSGVYYSTFTIDPAQLIRSWSGIESATARKQLEALITALIEALPTGKLSNTNAHTKPIVVLAENQRSRTVYEFETPVMAGPDGGYTAPTIVALGEQARQARNYDADNYLDTVIFNRSKADITIKGSATAASISDLVSRVAGLIMQSLDGDRS